MNNNGYFLSIWMYIWSRFIKSSVLYRALCRVYSFFSNQWKNGIITNFFRKDYLSDDIPKSGVFEKLLLSPFTLVKHIQTKHRERLTNLKETSVIIRICKYYLHNLLALNLRFISVLVVSASVVDLVVSILSNGSIKYDIFAIIIGAVLYLFDTNITDFLKDSAIIKAVEKLFDLDFSFDFYYLTKCGGKSRLFCAAGFGILAGLICAKFSAVFALAFIAGIWFFFMVLYKVEFGVFVTVFLAPIIPTMALVGLSLFCLVSLLIKAVTIKKFELRTDKIGFMLIVLILVYLFSALTSFAPIKSLQIWTVYLAFIVFYFIIINTIKTSKQLKGILTVFCISGFLVCLYGIMQYVFGWNTNQSWVDEDMFQDIKMRIYATLGNPNVLGEYILLVMPVSIALMWKNQSLISKTVFAAISAIMGVALILTFSRGCWIGIMVSAAIFITFAAGKLWGLALPLLPIIPMVLPDSVINRFTSIGNMGDSSTSYRVYIWMGTLLMLKDFWLSGIGPGTEAFTQVYPFYSYSAIVAPHSHNLFLQIWVESGILGISIFAILLALFVKKLAIGHSAFGKGHRLSVMMVGLGAGVLGFLVQGLFDNCFYNYRVFMIFWSVLAFCSAAANIAKDEANLTEV